MPGGAAKYPARPPNPQSVRKALPCVKLIGLWPITSKNRQHDWLRRMVNIQDASHSTSSSSAAHKSLSTHAMKKEDHHRTPHAVLSSYVCIACHLPSVAMKSSIEWSTFGTD